MKKPQINTRVFYAIFSSMSNGILNITALPKGRCAGLCSALRNGRTESTKALKEAPPCGGLPSTLLCFWPLEPGFPAREPTSFEHKKSVAKKYRFWQRFLFGFVLCIFHPGTAFNTTYSVNIPETKPFFQKIFSLPKPILFGNAFFEHNTPGTPAAFSPRSP